MPLVPLDQLLAGAASAGYAVGYFEAWDSYSLEAVVEAAEVERAPVIIGFGGMLVASAWLDAGGIELYGCMGRRAAERATVPTALILNEVHTLDQIRRGIDAGFNAVMLGTSELPWDEAVARVKEEVELAHASGVAVEAELGRLPDAVGDRIDDSEAELTDPERAAEFVRLTGVDCLAVSIGNVHLLTTAYAPVNLAHLENIHRRVHVPLVIHGGSSFPPEMVSVAIARGVAKMNVGTVLRRTFLSALREAVQALPDSARVHDVLGSHGESDLMNVGKALMRTQVRELIRIYGASGRAVSGEQ